MRKYFYVDSPLYKLECTAKICERHFSRSFKENYAKFGITQGEFCVLDTVVKSPEISQIELARLLYKGRSHITQNLNSLEEKKIIKRVDVTKNGRKVRQTILTPKGEDIYEQIKNIGRTKFARMAEFFEKKEDAFVSMLSEIQEILTEGEAVRFD